MSDLDITISVDPGPAVTGADKITAAVSKTEGAAKAAKTSYASFGEQLARIGRLQQLDADAAARVTQSHRQQLAAVLESVRPFDGLTEALRREQQMLERIHGPMRQLQQDLQVLNKLEREGKINAEQHAAALLKSGAAAGIVTKSPSGGAGSVAGLGGIASDVRALKLSQVAQGASQAFELLNAQLHLTNNALGDALGSGIKFAALGAQIGGPWGAALGGLVGLTVSLADELHDLIDGGAYARRMKALQEEAEANRQLANSYKSIREELENYRAGLVDLSFAQAKAHEDAIRAAHDQLDGGAILDAREKVRQLTVALFTVKRERERLNDSLPAGAFKSGVSDTEILLERQLRDARIELATTSKTYGKVVTDLKLSEQHHLDAQVDLKRAYEAGDLTLKQYNSELSKLNGRITTAAASVTGLKQALVSLNWNGPSSQFARHADITGVDAISGADLGVASFKPATLGFSPQIPTDVPEPDPMAGWNKIFDDVKLSLGDAKKGVDEAGRSFDDLNKHAATFGDIIGGPALDGVRSLSDALVDAANGGAVSWSSTFKSIGIGIERAIAQALILKAITGNYDGSKGAGVLGGYGGLLGLLGGATGLDAWMTPSGLHRIPAAATGYDGIVPGAGSTDSRLAMIRVTPGESIHVRTPEQRRAAATPRGATTISNHIHFDKRDLLAANDTPDGHASIINAIRINAGVVKAILGR